ncbi:Uma2 family endonuclease [Paenibacillus mesophilus]|uniref:Uma2 family endonuclease n=1 Tax=Paenibacillus mesophilus TaxID=2582849 RepID=UPI00130544B3|nr:Uma2 family endonuclease [Paenibacillus mesophilus]
MFQEHDRYEVWDGEIIMMTPASPRHEKVVLRISNLLGTHIDANRLGGLYGSNTAVYLTGKKDRYRMPDLSFVAAEREDELVREDGIFGSPDLIVEILSPGLSAYDRDLVEKYNNYEQFGVKEYWIVDPFDKTIRVHTLKDGGYALADRSILFPELVTDTDELFRGLPDVH